MAGVSFLKLEWLIKLGLRRKLQLEAEDLGQPCFPTVFTCRFAILYEFSVTNIVLEPVKIQYVDFKNVYGYTAFNFLQSGPSIKIRAAVLDRTKRP